MKFKKIIVPTLLSTILLTSCNQNGNIKFTYNFSYGKTDDYSATAFYTDSYFKNKSTEYNSSLATSSLAFAMASFASNVDKTDLNYRYRNADKFLKNANFSNIDCNSDYKKTPGMDTFGVVFGTKKIDDYTIIAIGTRGGNYEMEWASNFTLGNGTTYKGHQGFYDSSTIYLDSLEEYINKYNITGKCKLWAVGYSRGGATNNIAIGRIDQKINNNEKIFDGKITLTKEDIYCYCFEPPMGASFKEDISPRSEIYSNIFNIVNPNDLVPKIAPKEFRFTRYGIDYYLPDKIRNINYSSLIKNVVSNYQKMSDYSVLGEYTIDDFKLSSVATGKAENDKVSTVYSNRLNYTSGLFSEELLTYFVNDAVYTLDNYVETFQGGLRNFYSILYKSGSVKTSVLTIGTYFVKYLLSTSDIDLLINTLLNDPLQFMKDFTVLISQVFTDLGINIDPTELYKTISDLLGALVNVSIKHLYAIFTLINTSNIKSVILGHYPEVTISHLMNQDSNYTNKIESYNHDGSYYYLKVEGLNSSTSINILNNEGLSVSKVENGYLDTTSTITCGNDSYNYYYCYLPVEASYNIKISNAKSYSLSYFDQRYENLVEYKADNEIGTKNIDITTTTYPERG